MAHISYSGHGENPLARLLGHNPALCKQWMDLLDCFYKCCTLDPQLQEEVRKVVAYHIGCSYCMSHGCPLPIIEDSKTQMAIDFARKIMQLDRKILVSDVELLKPYFSEKEIVELCAFVCYGVGLARFGVSFQVDVVAD